MIKHGCKIVCVDLSKDALNNLNEELQRDHPKEANKVYYYTVDITKFEEVQSLGEVVSKEVGAVTVLINNAGIMNKGKLLLDLTEDDIRNIYEVNVLSQFWMCKVFLPKMIQENKGHVLNVSSSLGFFGAYKLTDYCSSKFAVSGFTESLRSELDGINEDNKIKVSLVCPFHVQTKLFGDFEFNRLNWLNVSLTPEKCSKQILDGLLSNKELIGCPKFTFYFFLAIKK